MKRFLALVLTVGMLCGALAGCGGDKVDAEAKCQEIIDSIVTQSGYEYEDTQQGSTEDGQTFCAYRGIDKNILSVSVKSDTGNPHRFIYASINEQDAEKMLPYLLSAAGVEAEVTFSEIMDTTLDVGNGFTAFALPISDSDGYTVTVTEGLSENT